MIFDDVNYIKFRIYSAGYFSMIMSPAILSFLGDKYHNVLLNGILWIIFYYIYSCWCMWIMDIKLLDNSYPIFKIKLKKFKYKYLHNIINVYNK